MDKIKKRNRNGSSLADGSRKSVPSITATVAAHGIASATGRNSITSAAATPPLAPFSGLGSPTELAMEFQQRSCAVFPLGGLASNSVRANPLNTDATLNSAK